MVGVSGGRSTSQTETNPNNAIGVSEGGGSTFSQGVQNPDTVWGPQAKYLQGLYGQGANLAQNFGQYEQGAQGIYDQAAQGFGQMMDPGISPQLEAYQRQVQNNLQDSLLPAIQGGAGMAGQMGGSRQGVAEGLALARGNQQVTDMAANLYNDDMNRMMGAMNMAPGLGQFGMSIPWYAMNQYAGILGQPTTLGGGGATSGGGSDFSRSFSRDIGGGGHGSGSSWNVGGSFGKVA